MCKLIHFIFLFIWKSYIVSKWVIWIWNWRPLKKQRSAFKKDLDLTPLSLFHHIHVHTNTQTCKKKTRQEHLYMPSHDFRLLLSLTLQFECKLWTLGNFYSAQQFTNIAFNVTLIQNIHLDLVSPFTFRKLWTNVLIGLIHLTYNR